MPEWIYLTITTCPGRKMNPLTAAGKFTREGIYDIVPTYGIITAIRAVYLRNGIGVEERRAAFLCKRDRFTITRIDFISEHLKWLHKGSH